MLEQRSTELSVQECNNQSTDAAREAGNTRAGKMMSDTVQAACSKESPGVIGNQSASSPTKSLPWTGGP